MNILIAPDKFKGSLSAQAVCAALQQGLESKLPDLNITTKPLADGGDGSLAVLDHYFNLKTIERRVDDPLRRSILAAYKFDVKNKIAYVELSAASGLVLLKNTERNPLLTTTLGTGELIKDALEQGAKTIYLFIGGSATNDGGIGIAEALGYAFYNKNNERLAPIGASLSAIDRIEKSGSNFNQEPLQVADTSEVFATYDSDALTNVTFKVICDVNNPFYGKNGAAHVYARQKGANDKLIKELDNGLKNLANVLIKNGYADISKAAGAGAAGGVGGGMMAFFNAELQSGIQLFLEWTALEKAMQECDLVITGEGKLDAQTAQGKVISGVCQLAKKYQKPVIAVCGAADRAAVKNLELKQIYTVLERSKSVAEAMEKASEKLLEIGATIGKNAVQILS